VAAPGLRFVSNSRDRHSGPVSPVQTGGAVIDADDLPPDMKRFFDALVSAEAAFKAELENLLKKQGHMPDDKCLLISRKGKRLGVAYASAP
jgi:hypothetical protein